jgi:omega-amidase
MTLVSLSFVSTNSFKENLQILNTLIVKCKEKSLILAPEVCISGFCYDRFDEAAMYSNIVIQKLKEVSTNKTIALTLIVKYNNEYFNELHIFHNNELYYQQKKAKLFALGDEHKYFTSGSINDINIIEIDGIKIATLICFELRFIELWQKLKGVDVILVPAMWGKLRTHNFKTLTNALAISNQCYVVASNSLNADMAANSAIINPFGIEVINDNNEILTLNYDEKEIQKMRRYINIGIK